MPSESRKRWYLANREPMKMPIKYLTGFFLSMALVWSLITLQAEPSFYYSLLAKIGVLNDGHNLAQYANVTYCNKTVSVTANHVVETIDKLRPTSKLLAANREYDLAIYESLGSASPSPLAQFMPSPFDEVYIPTYVWMNGAVVVYRYLVIGYSPTEILPQAIFFLGTSGSGVYNKDGEYLGPVLNMLNGIGPGGTGKQQAGIGGIGRTDKLIELFNKEICDK